MISSSASLDADTPTSIKPVLVAGEINVDLILSGCERLPEWGGEVVATDYRQVPGSSSMIFACGLARLGERVRFAGRAGRDAYGVFCRDAMRDAGVDVDDVLLSPDLATGVTVSLSAQHDRALVTFTGAIDALAAEDVTDLMLEHVGHLHVSSYYLQGRLRSGLAKLFARAHRLGVTTSLDPGFDPSRRWGADLIDVLKDVDVFLPNRVEACAISGAAAPDEALHAFANGHTCTVIKCGAEGSMALEGGEIHRVDAFPVAARDSTGAGDSFDAGFVFAWRRHRPLIDCLRWGSASGSLSTRGIGGTASQARAEEVQALLGVST